MKGNHNRSKGYALCHVVVPSGVASLLLGAPSGALAMWMEELQAGLRPRRRVYLAALEGERRRYIAPAIPPAQACVRCRAGAVAQVPSKRISPIPLASFSVPSFGHRCTLASMGHSFTESESAM
ncbi:hypothetical protein BKA56DRAFT_276450 [Ilyonectria sp. MPI-CAGE-AT-0026]|nr:hypothetical protein BKA56DRAFT_276450 [Ilyonectria sp. MPI-CAGE-AT-0026]